MDAEQAMAEAVESIMDPGSRYLHMMYAAFKRECELPVERVCLVETQVEGGTMYRFCDINEITLGNDWFQE